MWFLVSKTKFNRILHSCWLFTHALCTPLHRHTIQFVIFSIEVLDGSLSSNQLLCFNGIKFVCLFVCLLYQIRMKERGREKEGECVRCTAISIVTDSCTKLVVVVVGLISKVDGGIPSNIQSHYVRSLICLHS